MSEVESPMFFYVCGHGSSNQACQVCFPGQPDMPDDWMATYTPPAPEEEPPA